MNEEIDKEEKIIELVKDYYGYSRTEDTMVEIAEFVENYWHQLTQIMEK